MLKRPLLIAASLFVSFFLAGCPSSQPPALYSLGGSISGLTSGSVRLKDNQNIELDFSTNGSFILNTNLSGGAGYTVSVVKQPNGLNCSVTNSFGNVSGVNVTDVKVTCNPYLYVTSLGNVVSGFSMDDGGVLTPLPHSKVSTGNIVTEIAIHPNNTFFYVVNGGSSSVSMYAIGTGGVLTPLSQPTVATGYYPASIAIHPSGLFAYVVNKFDSTVSMFAIGANGILTPLITPLVNTGFGPSKIAINSAGTYAYVTNARSISMYKIETNGILTLLTPSTVSIPDGGSIVIHPSGTFAYNLSVPFGFWLDFTAISMFSIGSNGQLAPLSTPLITQNHLSSLIAVHPTGKYLYTLGSGNNISMYSIGDNGILTALSTPSINLNDGTFPTGIAIDSAGRFLFTAAYSSGIWSFAIGSDGILSPPVAPRSESHYFGIAISR